jgi:hypothetical protein
LSFTIPNPKIATDYTTLFSTIEALETAFISAYEAAALAFAEMRRADLIKVAAQVAGVEAEHRALARLALGDSLPHNVAFESAQFTTVGAAAAALQKLGFIGGSGQTVTYATYAPSVSFASVINNTPGGVMASATAASTPAQMPSTMPYTGAGGMANHSTFPLWTLPAVVVGASGAALLGIRTRHVKSGR